MCFDAYANRVTDINQKAEQKKIGSKNILLKNTETKVITVNKVEFAS